MADTHDHKDGEPGRHCGTMQVHRRLLDTDRNYARRLARAENHCFRAMQAGLTMRPGCTRIPVVVHVVHKTAAQNISQAQIDSQIAILNADFRKKNADVSNVPAPFLPLVGDSRIEFALASTDPDGNPTNGVTRTETNQNAFDSDDQIKSDATGGKDAWDTTEYLNIWVGNLAGGLLGYAQFPGGPAATDGVVCRSTAFGDTGTAAAPFDKGRTATHEVGHWLNLRHIWGDDGGGCTGSDLVADTPNQGGPNTGKPTFPLVSCNNGPNGDMFMNYMDYVDDDTMVMFTEGQIMRMQACLDGPRSSIGESISCGGPLPKPPGGDIPKQFKELPKDNPKEFTKELIKEPIKESPKDGPKDFPKDLGKDGGKDGPKDFGKDPIKDGPKDPPKDSGKDGPKDFGKDGIKDQPKELIKDSPFDPGPKGIFEQPSGPGGGFPMQPCQPNMPFVLGTGAAPGASLQPPQQQPAFDPNQAILQHYVMILSSYADLYQRGMLDDQGMMGWRQTWAAYAQMGGQ